MSCPCQKPKNILGAQEFSLHILSDACQVHVELTSLMRIMYPGPSHKLKRISLGRKKSAAYKTNSIQNCKTHIRVDYVIQIGDRNKQARKEIKEHIIIFCLDASARNA